MTTTFVFNRAGMQHTFHSWEGMTGAYIGRKSRDLADLAKGSVGVDTAKLKGNITVEYGRTTTGGDLETKVGVIGTTGQLGYARHHHDGTSPHLIRPRKAKALRFVLNGVVVFAQVVRHPGSRGTKYLTRWLSTLF